MSGRFYNYFCAVALSAVIIATGCGVAFAQSADAEVQAEAGMTSASPFHVFERFGDWMRVNVLAFNPVRKAEVRLEIAEKRLAELRTIAESDGDSAVIER